MQSNKSNKRGLVTRTFALAIAVLLALTPFVGLQAQDFALGLSRVYTATPISVHAAADDTDIAILIQYIGTSASGTVTIEASGDLTLKSGALGSEAADTTLECPVSGALGGVIDVSNAACDTMGEVMDIINADASDWRAVLIDARRSDSSNDTLLAAAEASANPTSGLKLYIDTSTAFSATRLLATRSMREDLRNYVGPAPDYTLLRNPFANTRTTLFLWNGVSTYASGTSFMQLLADEDPVNAAKSSVGSQSVLYQKASGADGVATELEYPYAFEFPVGSRPLVRIKNSAAASAVLLSAYGRQSVGK